MYVSIQSKYAYMCIYMKMLIKQIFKKKKKEARTRHWTQGATLAGKLRPGLQTRSDQDHRLHFRHPSTNLR